MFYFVFDLHKNTICTKRYKKNIEYKKLKQQTRNN